MDKDCQPANGYDDDFDESQPVSVLRLGQLTEQQARYKQEDDPLGPERHQAGPENITHVHVKYGEIKIEYLGTNYDAQGSQMPVF